MQGSQSIEGGCCYILGVVEHLQKELDIDQGLVRQAGSRLVGVEQIVRLGSQEQGRSQDFGHRME